MRLTKHALLGLGSLLLFGCGGSGGGDGGGGSGAGTTNGNTPMTPGCSSAPACADCGTCSEKCFCMLGDIALCAANCGGGSPGPMATSTSPTPTGTSTGTTPVPTTTTTSTSTSPTPTTTSTTPTPTPTGTTPTPVPPAARSLTLTTDFFDAPPGGDSYFCQNFSNPFGQDVDIIWSESFMTAGSHHMFAFREPGLTDSGVMTCGGLEFSEYIHTAQTPEQVTSYPDGIGRFLPAGDGIRIQVHYINTGTEPIHAQVGLAIHYVDPSEVTAHAAQIFLNNIAINIAPYAAGHAERSYNLPYDINLLAAASHMHSRATNFVATANGQQIYQTTDWNEPVAAVFVPGMPLAGGSTITWACDYQNTTNLTLTFGESAATNEMCIFSGLYYPAPNGQGINSAF